MQRALIMPPTAARTPDEYIASLPDDRREAIATVRKVVRKNLPPKATSG